MNKFLEFLIVYRHELISLLVGVVVILVTFFKKKVKFVDVVKTIILDVLPTAINQAEKEYGSGFGNEKLAFTVKLVCAFLFNQYGIDQQTVNKYYMSFIEEKIEDILSTPQKKER